MDKDAKHSAGGSGRGADVKGGPLGGGLNGGRVLKDSEKAMNKPFDEALEFSQSGSDDSVDTRLSDKKGGKAASGARSHQHNAETKQQPGPAAPAPKSGANPSQLLQQQAPQIKQPMHQSPTKAGRRRGDEDEEESEADPEESYDNLEGAYNPKDFAQLNVSGEVRDLFQYIERYKPHEVELETTLKCFIPEYIPAIGEMDAFIKVPRPDKKEEELGLKFLDEPAAAQSDPTVLELQLRAMTKKLQYGDVVVRSIENASKNPTAIDKWVQSISDLHRSKPPPQVHYRRNMPDIDTLLDVWPEEFETMLETLKLPSPDLDLSLLEYAKILCAILDIPVYENPIESLHQLFSLFMDFRNNPHLQARDLDLADRDGGGAYGNADVMTIKQGFK
jgi:intraflagellar transport protein 46